MIPFLPFPALEVLECQSLYVGHHVVWDGVQRKLLQDLNQNQTEQEVHRKLYKHTNKQKHI